MICLVQSTFKVEAEGRVVNADPTPGAPNDQAHLYVFLITASVNFEGGGSPYMYPLVGLQLIDGPTAPLT